MTTLERTVLYITFGLTLGILYTGCATVPCRTAEEVASEKGMVLECRRNSDKYTGETVTECLVVLPDVHRPKWITVFRRHCGQYAEK